MFSNIQKAIMIFSLAALISVGSILTFSYRIQAKNNTCNTNGSAHQITIKNDKVSPEITDGLLCEKITFTNLDNTTREISFGPHEQHQTYDGVTEKYLNKNQSFTLTLNKAGMFHFHDHIHDLVMGYFNVYKQ